MNNSFGITILLAVFSFIACNNFNRYIKITGRYHLIAVDADTDMSLSYKIDSSDDYVGVVDQSIFAIGFNDNYIIAKQHPDNNRQITNYFIVPIYKEYTLFPEKDLIGPLTLEQFEEKSEELNIAGLAFSKEVDKLK